MGRVRDVSDVVLERGRAAQKNAPRRQKIMGSKQLTREDVKALAPDSKAFAVSEAIASEPWLELGRSDRALWGKFSGSGKAPYRVMVDARDELAYKCSCPSRKLPCKHTLGLLLTEVDGKTTDAKEPDDVVKWLDARDKRAKKRQEPKDATSTARSEKAVAAAKARAKKRDQNVADGVETLLNALDDVARLGLNTAQFREPKFWKDLAKRMVDFQAPGLANRVLEIAALDSADKNWNETVLRKIGLLTLLLEAAKRVENVSEDLAAEIRYALGYTFQESSVVETGERLEGEWLALGRGLVFGRAINTARDWFYHIETGRFARYLQYSRNKEFDETYPTLNGYVGAMRYWHGVVKMRATWESTPKSIGRRALPDGVGDTFQQLVEKTVQTRSNAPWTTAIPTLLKDVVVRPNVERCGKTLATQWLVIDSDGRAIPAVAPGNVQGEPRKNNFMQDFFEASYDAAVTLFGEWDGQTLTPLSAIS